MALSVSTSVVVTYDGYLESEIRGELLKEFVKYILYQRSQIPMYFDQIKELLHRQSGAVEHTVSYIEVFCLGCRVDTFLVVVIPCSTNIAKNCSLLPPTLIEP